MKTTKKILSVLLSVVLCLSVLGVAAFAVPPEGNWTPIPTSPNGLQAGEVYLDFTPAFAEENAMIDASETDIIDCMNNGTWYVDCENHAVYGTYGLPQGVETEGNAVDVIEPGFSGRNAVFFYGAVREVGVDWAPVKLTTDDLQNGDWYLDAEAAVEAMIDALVENEGMTPQDARDKLEGELSESGGVEAFPEMAFPYGLFVYPGKTVFLIKCIISETGKELVMNPQSDNPEEVEFYCAANGGIRQYKAPVPEKPTKSDFKFAKILAKFMKLLEKLKDLLTNLLKIVK